MPLPASVGAGVALAMELWADNVSHKEPDATYRSVRYAMKNAFFSSAKAVRELGYRWRPSASALEDAVRWFRERGLL